VKKIQIQKKKNTEMLLEISLIVMEKIRKLDFKAFSKLNYDKTKLENLYFLFFIKSYSKKNRNLHEYFQVKTKKIIILKVNWNYLKIKNFG
jgi:hypothetical protein